MSFVLCSGEISRSSSSLSFDCSKSNSSQISTLPVNILPTQLSTFASSRKRKRASSLDESLQQTRQTYAILSPRDDTSFFQNTDECLHIQQEVVASSIQPISIDIEELMIKISSEMGKFLSEMGKISSEMGRMSSEIDMIKNKLNDVENKIELL
ncbi:hypothetical protein CAJAP_00816 [Camponotus japonicus]